MGQTQCSPTCITYLLKLTKMWVGTNFVLIIEDATKIKAPSDT